MAEPRLKSGLLARALMRQAELNGRSAMMLRRGDEDAGAILLVLRDRRGGVSVLAQTRDAEGRAAWSRGTGPDAVDDAAADAYVARARDRDPDLWVIEIEGPDLALPVEGRIL